MLRADLIRTLHQRAKESGTTFQLVRRGAGHEGWRLGTVVVTVPRHHEISERTAQAIIRAATGRSRE